MRAKINIPFREFQSEIKDEIDSRNDFNIDGYKVFVGETLVEFLAEYKEQHNSRSMDWQAWLAKPDLGDGTEFFATSTKNTRGNLSKASVGPKWAFAFHYRLHAETGSLRKYALAIDKHVMGETFEAKGRPVFDLQTTFETAPFKLPPHVSEKDALAKNANVDIWLNPHNHHSIPLEGRDDEFALLNQFAGDDRHALSICELVAPSGAGKTRLVSQWMQEYIARDRPDEWDAGFVDSRDPEPWKTWQPTRHTLIVIDYTYNYDAVIGLLIDRLKNDAPKKIRLLLLDHVKSRDLRNDLALPEHRRDAQFLQGESGLYFRSSPIILKPEADKSLLLRHVIACAANLNTEGTDYTIDSKPVLRALKALMEIGVPQSDKPSEAEERARDSVRHPLFAALLGQQLRDDPGADLEGMSRRDLITQYFDRGQRLPWRLPEQNKYAENLGPWVGCYVAAATLLGGAAIRDLEDALPGETVRTQLARQNLLPVIPELCRKIVSSPDQRSIEPFRPDILGEAFVLAFLERFGADDEVMSSFAAMLGGQATPKKREAAASSFLETMQRLVRNLINEDQTLVATEWDTLFRFLRPARFPQASPIRQAVSIALGDIAKQCAAAGLDEHIPEALIHVDLADLDAAGAGPNWEEAAIAAVHCVECAAGAGDVDDATRTATRSILSNFKARSNLGWTALMLACAEGCLNSVRTVWESLGEDVNACNHSGWNALMVASYIGDASSVAWLLNEGADPRITLGAGSRTAAIIACENGNCEALESLHAAWPDAISKITLSGETAAIIACRIGNLEVLKFLHRVKPDLLAEQSFDGRTAAIVASKYGQLQILEYFHDEVPGLITQATPSGETAAMAACRNNHFDILEFLHRSYPKLIVQRRNDGWTSAMFACQSANLDALHLLHREYPDLIAQQSVDGTTAAMVACRYGRIALFELTTTCSDYDLKEVDLFDDASRKLNVYQIPVIWENALILDRLSDTDIYFEFDFPANEKLSPEPQLNNSKFTKVTEKNFQYVLKIRGIEKKRHLDVLDYLHQSYPGLFLKTRNDGWTSAMAACEGGHLDVLEFIHTEYPDLVVRTMKGGWTAVLFACRNGHLDVLEFLHREYPDLFEQTTKDGRTAAKVASDYGQHEVLEFLRVKCPGMVAQMTNDGHHPR